MYKGRNSDGRLPFQSQFDLYVQHKIDLGSRVHLTLSANMINLFNQSGATNYYPRELFEGQIVAVDEVEFFQGIDTQALIDQQQLVRDPRFMMTSSYQTPRTVRLGAKVSF